jgi:hypothetical protein
MARAYLEKLTGMQVPHASPTALNRKNAGQLDMRQSDVDEDDEQPNEFDLDDDE